MTIKMFMAATFAVVLMPHPAWGGEVPARTALDDRIREVTYSDSQVYEITGVFRAATQIVFAPGETIEHVALGDTVSWEVAPADNSLFIKPREFASATNLVVLTNSAYGARSYTFHLKSRKGSIAQRGGDTFFKVRFRYPAQERAEAERAAAQIAAAEIRALESRTITSALAIGVVEGVRNIRYSVQGDSRIQPSEISDNGQFTALRFPAQRELPAFFAVNADGSEAIVPFDVRGEFVIVHGVYQRLRLRRGQSVLCVYNDDPAHYGRDPETGTASSLIERTTVDGSEGEP